MFPQACWSRRRYASSRLRVPWMPSPHALCICRRLTPCTRLCYSPLHALQRVLRPHISLQVSVCRAHGCLGDMAIWHGVVMLVASEVYAAVGGHLEIRIRDYLKVCCRQRIQVGTVDGKEEFLAACTHVCEDGRG